MSRLGTEFTRLDAAGKTAGTARYTDDLAGSAELHGAVVRSAVPAGRIAGIDASRARELPGVVAVLTARDVPSGLQGLFVEDEPLLARDRVRYVGEPVALVAAGSRTVALAAAQAVRVSYEEKEAVVDLRAAALDEARRVHDDRPNHTESSRILRGDVDGAFARAHVIVTTVVDSHRVHQAYIEPRAATAEWSQGRLSVTTTSQAPFEVRAGLSKLFGLPLNRVSVRVPTLGGGFGGKLHLGMAPIAAVLARHTGCRVSVLCSREEEFQTPAPRENSRVELVSAVSADGDILARRARILLDSGAYAYDIPPVASVAALQACGPYQVGAVDIVSGSVYTNTVPTGSFRAPSGPQMSYAVEAHMNDIAERLGIDPLELRERCALREGHEGPTGQVMRDPAMAEVLRRGREYLATWRGEAQPPPPGKARGYGLGCAIWTVSPVGSAATLTMNEDGTATVITGATEIGTGAVSETLAAIVADELGIDNADVLVSAGDTDRGSVDHGSQGSRTLYGVGTAIASAAAQVREVLLRQYAHDHEIAVQDCELRDGTVRVRGIEQLAQPLAEVITAAMDTGGPVAANGRFQPSPVQHDPGCVSGWVGAFNEPTFHCHAAQVEVDLATGAVEVQRYAAVHDTGPVLNPHGARGQVHGGVVQGLGYALSEEIVSDDRGRVVNANLHDYRVPTILDVPETIDVHFVTEHPGSEGYRGLKGIGEAPAIPGAAAIGSAVRDAIGVQPASCSMTPETVLRLMAGLAPATIRSGEAT
ncbi:xanthine dehydrogenase family protein molybdopterin-binding subunit [Actinomadura formosensis]|uniref:xanthine dehydrogenase family protein molybdopterin-binding subunit n=1 Tax=Actinomadura formosensis TaxID=60706 RepID=UPI000835E185|nr:xanthine dehydrogenase family protein molybdopterin-binding subunit [Actinomadura formosensis]